MANPIIDALSKGQLPEIPFTATVDDSSIIKISVAAIIVATIIILISHIVKK